MYIQFPSMGTKTQLRSNFENNPTLAVQVSTQLSTLLSVRLSTLLSVRCVAKKWVT
jgi:hypothetical protein